MDFATELLANIRRRLSLNKGLKENEDAFICRTVYTTIALAAKTSLYDVTEEPFETCIITSEAESAGDTNPQLNEGEVLGKVSIAHLFKRICSLCRAYCEIYPQILSEDGGVECDGIIEDFTDHIASEIYEVFNLSGIIYHNPYWVTPCAPVEANVGGLVFTRGQKICFEANETYGKTINDAYSLIQRSGVGAFYMIDDLNEDRRRKKNLRRCDLREMFQLSNETLDDFWRYEVEEYMCEGKTEDLTDDSDKYQYLRLSPKFTHGYFVDDPNMYAEYSLARTKLSGERQYYLYRIEGQRILALQLPLWKVQQGEYRRIANAILNRNGVLPPTLYIEDGCIVNLEIQYLYPPAEMNFLRAYSWPASFKWNDKFGFDVFNRVMDARVFGAVKDEFEAMGYRFERKG